MTDEQFFKCIKTHGIEKACKLVIIEAYIKVCKEQASRITKDVVSKCKVTGNTRTYF